MRGSVLQSLAGRSFEAINGWVPATRMAPGVVSDAAALFTAGLLGLGTVLLGLWIILGLGYSILVDRRRMTICRRHWWEKAFAIGLGTAAACIVVALLPGLLQALNHLTSSRPDVLVVSTAIGLAVVALAAKYLSTLRRYRHLTAVWLTIVTVAIVALELIWLLRDHAIWMLAGSVFLLVVSQLGRRQPHVAVPLLPRSAQPRIYPQARTARRRLATRLQRRPAPFAGVHMALWRAVPSHQRDDQFSGQRFG